MCEIHNEAEPRHHSQCPLAGLSPWVLMERRKNLARIASLIRARAASDRPLGREQQRIFASAHSVMFGHQPLAVCEGALLDHMLGEDSV